MITLYAFKWVPPFAQGLVRDLRVRWALEEAGLPYSVKLLGQGDQDSPEYRKIQPWGQVPAIEADSLVLFESGAIVQYIAERSEVLMPRDAAGRALVAQWLFAAQNSVEPHISNLANIDLFHPDEAWAKARRPDQEAFTRMKLASLAKRLAGREWLEDRFTAGDLMMVTVLRNLRHTDIVTADAVLGPYVARGEARPAFQRALSAQLATFDANAPELTPA
ncbi:glutathione S-transferase family protein [Phenylobacterium sp.]|jgi:glutathione S-transferase|uniref:glutathione S-transferase family protein n=1 Tax=Phenylobacterium sp. TaxID=1871053 RepID=UPI002E325788|nr:glutathione S-transferase family protein [Phenylobacterium sp.]HEX2560332.1 glutathione S-transferase family protein [Phenylobacterium sp.]